jgi:hypothetical protein
MSVISTVRIPRTHADRLLLRRNGECPRDPVSRGRGSYAQYASFRSCVTVGFHQAGIGWPAVKGSGLYEEDLKMLAERLDIIRQGADKRIPPDKRAIMHRATDELRASGIMDGVIKVGDPLPPFALKNAFGQEVRSSVANGPLVLTVFRGSW